jgi:hypothetical protein
MLPAVLPHLLQHLLGADAAGSQVIQLLAHRLQPSLILGPQRCLSLSLGRLSLLGQLAVHNQQPRVLLLELLQ